MAKYTEDTKENTDLHQQMLAQNPTPGVDRQDTQRYTLENDQPILIENGIKKKKFRWIGHKLRKPPETIIRLAITWNPSGKRRGRPRNTWQRETEKETKEMGYTRREMEKMATDRKRWRSLVDGLCSQRAKRHK